LAPSSGIRLAALSGDVAATPAIFSMITESRVGPPWAGLPSSLLANPSLVRFRRQLRRSPRLANSLRYVTALAGVVAVTEAIQFSSLPKALGGVLSVAALLFFAWVGGPKPALLMGPLLLLLARLASEEPDRWSSMKPQEVMGLAVVTLVATTTGLAGQYRRRVAAVTRQHARTLQQQARALNQATIVFRSIDGRITDWSEGPQRLFGWTATEACGASLHELLSTRFAETRSSIDNRLMSEGQWHGEVTMRHKNGADLQVSTHWILYRDEENEPIGVAEVWSDVTELRCAEASIRDASRRKDEFLAMLAHELRNPLAPIRTGLEVLRLCRDDLHEFNEIHGMMDRQMRQLVALIDDLLDASRITHGKFELRKMRVVLPDIIKSAVETVAPAMEDAHHQLTVNLPTLPVHLDADPNRLAQVISNLLDNACKYTPPGGEIRLTVTAHGHEVSISVVDNGRGIPEGSLNSVFEMFNRNNLDGIATCSGLGIGLALVKTIVEMHGGTVSARSNGAGQGSEFLVRLPAISDAATAADGPTTHTVNGDVRRVLVVDDNVDAVRALSIVVKRLGNEVHMAYDGLEAIAAAEKWLPEIVILDLGMPKLDGYGAARHIRQQTWGKGMTLIALTGWGQDEDKRKTKEAGFDYHLAKPADLDELRRLISSGRQFPEPDTPTALPITSVVG
jgi:PAS domain S-box-containing protein